MIELTKRQIQILKRLKNEGTLTQEQLKARYGTLQDLYFAGLADGWFQISGGTPDDRYWAITDKGREAIS